MSDLTGLHGSMPGEMLTLLGSLIDGGVGKIKRTGVQTTGVTATNALLIPMPTDNTSMLVFARVTGVKSDGSQAAGYIRASTFRRASGSLTQVGATTAIATHEDDAAWDCDIAVSTTNAAVVITGKASTTINWNIEALYIGG